MKGIGDHAFENKEECVNGIYRAELVGAMGLGYLRASEEEGCMFHEERAEVVVLIRGRQRIRVEGHCEFFNLVYYSASKQSEGIKEIAF